VKERPFSQSFLREGEWKVLGNENAHPNCLIKQIVIILKPISNIFIDSNMIDWDIENIFK